MESASDMIRSAMKAEGVTIGKLARLTGENPNSVSQKLIRGTMIAPTFIHYADVLGYDVILRKRESSETLNIRRHGIGRRLRLMVGRVIYDTSKADAICYTPEHDGWFIELYRTDDGNFFAAHYTSWQGAEDHISTISKDDAYRLYLAYGDGSMDHFFVDQTDATPAE